MICRCTYTSFPAILPASRIDILTSQLFAMLFQLTFLTLPPPTISI